MMPRFLFFICMLAIHLTCWGNEEKRFAAKRQAMMQEIGAMAMETRAVTGLGIVSPPVLEVVGKVPRHRFVPKEGVRYAYRNRPLPIGYGQTISQPFLVAYMTELLQVGKHSRVLEIGTGSGYQAAILAELVKDVYTIEIIEPLASRAAAVLGELGYGNVKVKPGDGYYGWEEHAPFDAIMVTAAASYVPPPLVAQLKPGGRMLIPLGASFMPQHLVLVEKDQQGRIRTRELLPERFVPLTGGH
jgi:protein-L-isoaspartate(D-aspartate) O-methyltransferase